MPPTDPTYSTSMTNFTLDPTAWLTHQIDLATAEGRNTDALMLSVARDAVALNEELLIEIRSHRFDTAHLVEKLGRKPRLADQMLYERAGLDAVEVPPCFCVHDNRTTPRTRTPNPHCPLHKEADRRA